MASFYISVLQCCGADIIYARLRLHLYPLFWLPLTGGCPGGWNQNSGIYQATVSVFSLFAYQIHFIRIPIQPTNLTMHPDLGIRVQNPVFTKNYASKNNKKLVLL